MTPKQICAVMTKATAIAKVRGGTKGTLLNHSGEVCALGAVALACGVDEKKILGLCELGSLHADLPGVREAKAVEKACAAELADLGPGNSVTYANDVGVKYKSGKKQRKLAGTLPVLRFLTKRLCKVKASAKS